MAKKTDQKEAVKDTKSQVKTLKDELVQLRLEHAQGKLKNTSLLSLKRKEIARLLTALRITELTK